MKATTQGLPVSPDHRGLILPLFLISGATGLVYEVTWMRSLGTVFGNTVFAASTILTAFMLGLAIGSWLLGRHADRMTRPLRLYAWLELGIGVYAFAFPAILNAVDRFYLWFYQTYQPGPHTLNLVRFVVSILILLLPTVLMGGTLPVLSGLWAATPGRSESHLRTGQGVGLLYAVNTFGAVLGSFLSGYYLIRLLGVNSSIYVTATANVTIGVLAWLLSLGIRPRPVIPGAARRKQQGLAALREQIARAQESPTVYSERVRTIALVGVFVAGFCAMAMEVLWSRVLVFVLGTSAYAFACMLTCFVLGLALGSLLSSVLLVPRLKDPILAFGVIEFALALSILGSIQMLGWLWALDAWVLERIVDWKISFAGDSVVHFIDTLAVIIVPTVLMGMVFPVAVRICAPVWETVGRRVGQVYASNTIGCVLGSAAAGFLVIPLLGLRNSFLVVVAALFALAIVLVALSDKRHRTLAMAGTVVSILLVAACAVWIPRDVFLQTVNTYHHPSRIVFIDDGVTGTVTVHDLPDGDRLIAVDGVDVAGMDLMLRTTQKLQAYAPLLVHENPQDVVQIGYGSGETCGIGLDFGVARYTIVDICPGVFEAGVFFDEINRRSYANPKLRKVIMDGKNFIKMTEEKFDVIMNDSTYPGTTGSSALYTYDHFKACRDRLKPKGVLSCWVPLDLRPEDFRIIMRSFQAAMPHSSLWVVNNCVNKHAVLLGTVEPMQLDFRRIKAIAERPDIAKDLEQINVYCVYDFLDCLLVGERELTSLGGQGPLHTDDKPYLEFGAAIKRDVEGSWLDILRSISEHCTPLLDHVTNVRLLPDGENPAAILQQYSQATRHVLQGVVGALIGDPDIMNGQFAAARQANPQDRDVDSILEELRGEIRALEEAVERTPGAAELRGRLAKRYVLSQDYGRAIEQYEHFVQLRPGDGAAWNNLGICYRRLNAFDQAVAAFENALQRNPRLLDAYTNLAEARDAQGDLPGAMAALERLLPLLPREGQVRTHDLLAGLSVRQQKNALAVQHLDRAIELAAPDRQMQQVLIARRQKIQQLTDGQAR
ncbi:MAG: fused MFS/spermidine synthase [Phycisphaerae bacterium]|nr:fused MFS/spermidine synthase [Phycisphaerae bacterium]